MSLRKQATSLIIMHGADVLQPLVILPFAGQVLGPHSFGEYAYAVSIGQLAATLVEYGFHWTAQRAAAAARQQPSFIKTLYAEVAATKAILCFVVTLVGLAAATRFLGVTRMMFLCAMLTAMGGIVFPAWLLIGLERAWQAAVAVIVARVLALVCFLTLVTSPARIELAVAIQSAVPLVSGLVSLPFVAAHGFGGFRSLTLSCIVMQLRNGWSGFLFSFVERASMILPIPIVQHFGGYVAAGEYSLAEKFVSATRPLFRVLSETLLPRVAYLAQHDPMVGLKLIWRSLSTIVAGATLSLVLLFIGPYVISIFFGQAFAGAIPIVRAMSVIPILLNLNMCTANLYMFNYGHERAWSSLTLSGLLVFLAVAYLLSCYLSNAAIAVAVAVIAKEFVVLVVSAGFFVAYGTIKVLPSATGYNAGATGITAGALSRQCLAPCTFSATRPVLNPKVPPCSALPMTCLGTS